MIGNGEEVELDRVFGVENDADDGLTPSVWSFEPGIFALSAIASLLSSLEKHSIKFLLLKYRILNNSVLVKLFICGSSIRSLMSLDIDSNCFNASL